MMKRSQVFWLGLTTILLLLSALSAAASPRLEALLEKGNRALDAGRFDAAREVFAKGRVQAAGVDEPRWRPRFTFYLGVTEQTEGGKLSGEAGLAHLKRAQRYFEEVLEQQPQSAVTARNLALVYFQSASAHQAMGEAEQANAYIAKARQLADTEQKVDFAQRLEKQDLWRSAADFWEEVVKQNPRSSEPHRKMMDLYLGRHAADLVPYLWEILAAGQAPRAVDGGLEALAAGGWDKRTKIELLTVVAAGLARQVDEPGAFPDSYFGLELQKLEGDPDIGPGCSELKAVHVARQPPGGFRWWPRQGTSEFEDPPHGDLWPLDAFRELVRSLASWYRARRDFATAEGYYRLSLDLHRGAVDLEAFNGLVLLTVEGSGDKATAKAGLEALDREYTHTLFLAKADAYRRAELERIFEFHRTLAGLYGALGEWGDESTATSAIFQLEHARGAAERLEKGETVVKSRFTPEMANLLSVAYDRTGKVDKSRAVRRETAEKYRRIGDKESAVKVMQLDSSSLPQAVLRDDRLRPLTNVEGVEKRELDGIRAAQPYEKQILELKTEAIEKLDEAAIKKLEREHIRGKDQDGGG